MCVFQSRIVSTVQVIIGGHVFAAGLATYFGDDSWYTKCVMPCFRWMFDPERAHELAVKAAHYGLMPRVKHLEHPELVSLLWAYSFGRLRLTLPGRVSALERFLGWLFGLLYQNSPKLNVQSYSSWHSQPYSAK